MKFKKSTRLFSYNLLKLFHSKKNRGNTWKRITDNMGTGSHDDDQKPMFVPVHRYNMISNMPAITVDRLGLKREKLDNGYTYYPENAYTEMMPNIFHHYTPINNINGIIKSGGAFKGTSHDASTFNIKDDVMQHMNQAELLNKPINVSGSNFNRHNKNSTQSVPYGNVDHMDGGKAYYGGLYPLSPEEKAQAQIKDIDAIHRFEGNQGVNGYGRDKFKGEHRSPLSHKPIMRVNMSLPYEVTENGEKYNGTIGSREGDDMDEVKIDARHADQTISVPKGAMDTPYMSKNQKKKFRRLLKNNRSMVEPDKYTMEFLLGKNSPHLQNIGLSYGYN